MSWSFTLVCLDQIVNNAANVRYMSGGQFKVPIVFRGGNGIAHQLGATHSHRMESVYARIPGPDRRRPQHAVRCQGTAQELASAATIRSSSWNRKRCWTTRAKCLMSDISLPLGKAKVEAQGQRM